jgi:hypothetical protein
MRQVTVSLLSRIGPRRGLRKLVATLGRSVEPNSLDDVIRQKTNPASLRHWLRVGSERRGEECSGADQETPTIQH